MKLYPKVALITLTGALVFTLSVGTFTYFAVQSALNKSIGEQQLEITEVTIDKIDRLLYERVVDIRTIAKSQLFTKDLLQSSTRNSPGVASTVNKQLYDLSTATGPWFSLRIVNTKGQIVFTSSPQASLQTVTSYDKIAYDKAMVGELSISDLVDFEGRKTIVYATPIRDTTTLGEPVVGVLIGHFSWPVIPELLKDIEPQVLIINNEGIVLAQNSSYIKESFVGKNIKDSVVFGYAAQHSAQNVIISEKDSLTHSKEFLTSIHPQLGYLDYHGNNWNMVLEIPTDVAFASARDIASRIVIVSVVFALVSVIVIILLFSQIMLKPIKLLTATSKAIGSGNLSRRVTLTTRDELGELAQGFNEMAQKLQEVYGVLEKRVSEKTTELARKIEQMQKQNETLSNTKTAMLNLLEDAKELEEKLKIEKMSVEQKVVERTKQFNEEAAKLQASINTLNVGVVMTDTNQRVLMMNKAAKQMITSQDQHVGAQLPDTPNAVNVNIDITQLQKHFMQSFDLAKQISDCIKSGSSREFAEVNVGSRVVHLFLSPIKTVQGNDLVKGETIGVIVVMQDITEQKLVERSKDEFFSIASHELRTPLTAIKGNTSMIRDMYADKLTDPDLKQMIDDIHDGSVRLITIVNDFLNISRLEQGRMVFKKEAFDMIDFIESTIKEVQPLAEEKKLTTTFNKPDKLVPEVFGDKDRLKEVLINLLSNGVKFTDTGGISVDVMVLEDSVKVLVTDTGHGIPEANRNLLFRKFQQASSNILTRDTTRSTGLGLYIAKLIMEGMGGTIMLERSEENKGSTFSFSLPLASSAENAAPTIRTDVVSQHIDTELPLEEKQQ